VKTDGHISVARAEVRSGALTRHVAARYDGGSCYLVSTGLGLPRTWSIATDAVLDGFEKGLTASAADAPAERLKLAVNQARSSLVERCDHLVERIHPDATLVALLLAEGQLHVISAGPGRVYLQRGGRPKRLTARDDSNQGLLRARPSVCTTPIEPGDLLLAGSVTAFSMSAVAKAISVLTQDPGTTPAVLASLLTEPAAKAGVGAAAIVLRVR
jgi:serine/threonine protein phosphatase PrpC